MILLNGHSLTPARKVPVEALSLQLKERESTATMTPADMTGITVNSWVQDETEPGAGIVWRVKGISQAFATATPTVQLEHAIASLKDVILFGEHKPAQITGNAKATTCTAEQAIRYVLSKQSDWTLGSFGFSGVANPYKFDGDTLFDCLETISNSLTDAWWSYDMSRYPFRLNITQKSGTVQSELRASRNLRTITKTIDKSGMYTRFYPIGKNDLHIDGDYVERNVAEYGLSSKVETDQSIDTKEELTRWANERLKLHAEPTVTIDVDGLELADATGESLDRLRLGAVCRIPLPEFGTTITERIVSLTYQDKVHQPEVVKVQLSNVRQDLTKILADAIKSGRKGARTSSKKGKEDNAWFEDTNDHVAMCAKGIIGVDAAGNPNWVRLSQLIVDGTGLHSIVTDIQGEVKKHETRFEQDERKIGMVVGTWEGGDYIKAGEICLAINEDGSSEARIDANKVYIGNQKSTTVINGKLNASELTATKIKTLIGQIAVVQAQTIEATSLRFSSTGAGSGPFMSVRELVDAYKIVKTGNNYKLQVKRLNSTEWNDAPDSETFSRAVSSWTVAGGDGQVKVTANPQNQRYGVDVRISGNASVTENGTYTYEVECFDDDREEWLHTGATKEVTVGVGSLNPEAEYTDYGSTEPTGVSGMGDLGITTPSYVQNWYVITAKDGDKSKPYKLKLDGRSIYDDPAHDLYIGKSDNTKAASTINLSRNQSYTVWPCVHKYGHTGYANDDIMWGDGVTFHAPSGTAITMTRGAYNAQQHTYECSCTLSESVATSSSFTLYYMQ